MGKQRQVLDFYESEAWMVRSLIYHHPRILNIHKAAASLTTPVIAEPCAGRHAISGPLRLDYHLKVVTADVDRTHNVDVYGDSTIEPTWEDLQKIHGYIDFTVTNPTFNSAFYVLKKAIKFSRFGVAFLLRTTFTEPVQEHGRGFWLMENPPNRQIVLPRHSFDNSGETDMATCSWFIWDQGWISGTKRPNRPIEIDFEAKYR